MTASAAARGDRPKSPQPAIPLRGSASALAVLLFLGGLAVAAGPGPGGGPQAPPSRPLQPAHSSQPSRPARTARGGTVIVPDKFLRRWDPVTVFFDHDAGPQAGGPEDDPGRWVRMAPAHPGAFRWLDARTLQFRPAEPWPPLQRFTWTAGGAAATLDTLTSPPLRSVPAADAEGLDPVQSITLVFAEPVDPQVLRHMVSLELRPLPGLGGPAGEAPRAIPPREFTVKAEDRHRRSDPASYVLSLTHPIPLGTRAVLHFRLSLAEESPESALDLAFATAEPFRVVSLGCAGANAPLAAAGTRYGREQALRCGGEERQLQLEFSSPLGELSPLAARNLLRFEPGVAGLTFSAAGRQLTVSGGFSRDTLYRVALAPSPLADRLGRRLEVRGTSEVFLFFPPLASFLRWSASQGIAERFGPQMVPVEGRGDERIDLRIHPIDPLDRSFWPFPDKPVSVDESRRPPGPGEEPARWSSSEQLPPQELARRLSALGSPRVSTLTALPLHRGAAAAHFGLDLAPHLASISGRGAPGTYLVGIRRLDRSAVRSWVRVQVTDLSLTVIEEPRSTLFAVTSLASGKPVAGARVQVEGAVKEAGSKPAWQTLFSAATDAAGRAAWPAPGLVEGREVNVRRIVVRQGADALVLDPDRPPDLYEDGRWEQQGSGWLSWTHESLEDRGAQPEILCHIFTERPVYRPGEKVHIKGYLRRREHGLLAPLAGAGRVVVAGPGDLVWRYDVRLTPAGSFYHAFAESDLPTGVYSAHYEDADGKEHGKVSFRIEAYRIPRFEVRLDAPERVPLDREFKVGLTADYYAGGRVTGRPLAWRVTQFPYVWTPQRRTGFFYSSDGRYSRTSKFESTPRLERQDTTDASGGAALVLNPAIEPTAQPRSYVVEATVTGADDQTVTATRQVIALPPFVLGLKVPRYLEKATRVEPQLLVLGLDDRPLAGLPVRVRLLQRQWHSHLQASDFSEGVARYRTDVVDEKVSETVVASGAAPVTVPLALPRSGVYLVELEATDKLGRTQVVSVDFYAGGEQPVTWARPQAGTFTAAADKTEYKPGDTATLVLESPFQQASALAIVEAPEGNRYEWLPVQRGAATFKVPVLGSYAPRLPVHFILMRGRVPGTAPLPGSTADLGKPATAATTAWLKVEPVANRVEARLTYPEKARPGQKIEIKIALSDPQGRPLAGEVALWLVDQAVLSLGREQRLDPLPDFITEVSSHLGVRDSRNLAFGFLPFAENPGGEAGGAAEAGSLLDRATVRRNFKPVPYYNPAIEVGPGGVAAVTVELPDDLTIFKLRAKVASGPDRFGYATGQIAVRLPVIVQPALPRFVRAGDRFKAAAVARIVEGEGGPATAEARVDGATLEGRPRLDFRWAADKPERLEFPVVVPTPAYREDGSLATREVVFRIAAERASDQASDAFETRLPLRDDRRRVETRLLQEVAPGGALAFPAVAEAVRPGSVRRQVLTSDQPALVRMAAGLDFLLAYPYGCTEQRLARARAELALTRFRQLLHQEGGDAERKRAVADVLAWLPQVIDGDGLVAYWPGARGYVVLTAWSVQFLVEARSAGFQVDAKLFATLTQALARSLRSDSGRFIDGEAFTERTWALAALAAAGKFDPAYAAELARRAQFLDLEGIAQVVQAFALAGDTSSPTTGALADRLWEGVVMRLYNGRRIYGGLQGRATPRNALILPSEARTLAELTRALARRAGADPRLPVLVQALTTLGRDDGWGSTNANASALGALSELLKPPFAGSTPHTLEVLAGGARHPLQIGPASPIASLTLAGAGAASAGSVSVAPRLAGAAGAPGGGGAAGDDRPLVVRVETSYLPAADGSQAAPQAAGFVVSRELLQVRQEGSPADRTALDQPGRTVAFKVGDVIEEHVRVVNPADRNYVAVTVPLAAGLEPLNPALATAPPEARPSGSLTRAATYLAFLDDQVAYYYDTLPKGTYDFYFRTRATTEGSFQQPPARAEMMYDGAVQGTSAGARIEVGR